MNRELPDCPDCGRTLAPAGTGDGTAECHDCNQRYETGTCEECGDAVTEQAATVETLPGATLWFCEDCTTVASQRGRFA